MIDHDAVQRVLTDVGRHSFIEWARGQQRYTGDAVWAELALYAADPRRRSPTGRPLDFEAEPERLLTPDKMPRSARSRLVIRNLLEEIERRPAISKFWLLSRYGESAARTTALGWLLTNGYVTMVKILGPSVRSGGLLAITEAGREYLRSS